MKLSLLIPHLISRNDKLNRLMDILTKQESEDIEILLNVDNGIKSIGQKRNELLSQAKGKYCTFIDDDDRVSPKYIRLLLHAINTTEVDVCSLTGSLTINGKQPKKFIHSIHCDGWYEKGGILYRYPNHLNCIKTDIARQIGFPEINHGEDADYSKRLQESKLIKSEYYIADVLYYYDKVTDNIKKR